MLGVCWGIVIFWQSLTHAVSHVTSHPEPGVTSGTFHSVCTVHGQATGTVSGTF